MPTPFVFRVLRNRLVTGYATVSLGGAAQAQLDPATFQNPPPDARPMTWMHMMNNNASKGGLTNELNRW